MSNGTPTPGPWKALGMGVFAGSDCIAVCDTDNASTSRMEANSCVMAAAPDMLAALKKWREYDALLRTITTDDAAIYGGQIPTVDAAYDECVAATEAAIVQAEGRD